MSTLWNLFFATDNKNKIVFVGGTYFQSSLTLVRKANKVTYGASRDIGL